MDRPLSDKGELSKKNISLVHSLLSYNTKFKKYEPAYKGKRIIALP